MKTIVFFNSETAWGGGEKWHLEMAAFMNEKGYNVIVYCQEKGALHKKLENTSITVRPVTIKNLSFLNPFKLYKLYTLFKKDQPDLIVLNISKDVKSAALAAKWAKVDKIVYRRGSAIPIKDKWINRWYFKNVITNILANSLETKKTINEKNANLFPEDKIEVVYNGLHLHTYTVDDSKQCNAFVIGNLGRLEYQKNQVALLELASVLKDKIENFKVVIGGDGRLMQELKQKTKSLKLENIIEFRGYVSNVSSFMSELDVFVLPSHWEGFGYVIAEASYHKKPVLAYSVSSNPEIIKEKETGYLVAKDDIGALADCIIKLKNSSEHRKELGINGNAFVQKNFNAKVNQKKVEDYFLKLCSQ